MGEREGTLNSCNESGGSPLKKIFGEYLCLNIVVLGVFGHGGWRERGRGGG